MFCMKIEQSFTSLNFFIKTVKKSDQVCDILPLHGLIPLVFIPGFHRTFWATPPHRRHIRFTSTVSISPTSFIQQIIQ